MINLSKKVIDAVLDCKDLVLAPFTVEQKDSAANIVTSADKNVENQLKKSLLQIIPDAAFLGEESEMSEGNEYCFVVDPIDGTMNFARGYALSAISVGLTKNGEGILGVVYNPFTDELYTAEKGKGAYLNGKKISVSSRDFSHSLYYTALCVYKKELAESCINILRDVYETCDDFRREGSAALELCRLASGKAELYFEIRLFPWDSLAAEVILNEAGGISARLYTENRKPYEPFPFVAANNKENFEKLLSIVKKEIPEIPANY